MTTPGEWHHAASAGQVPPGFTLLANIDEFVGHIGPFYQRRGETAPYLFGLATDARHGNRNGVLHGGVLYAFLDTVMGTSLVQSSGRKVATVSMETQYIGATAPGRWIEGRVTIRRETKSMGFVDGEAWMGDELLLSCAGVFRVFNTPQTA